MNDADRKLIDGLRTYDDFGCHEAADRIEELLRALADTPTLVEVPLRWCAQHAELIVEGNDQCARNLRGAACWSCDPRPLAYIEPQS